MGIHWILIILPLSLSFWGVPVYPTFRPNKWHLNTFSNIQCLSTILENPSKFRYHHVPIIYLFIHLRTFTSILYVILYVYIINIQYIYISHINVTILQCSFKLFIFATDPGAVAHHPRGSWWRWRHRSSQIRNRRLGSPPWNGWKDASRKLMFCSDLPLGTLGRVDDWFGDKNLHFMYWGLESSKRGVMSLSCRTQWGPSGWCFLRGVFTAIQNNFHVGKTMSCLPPSRLGMVYLYHL